MKKIWLLAIIIINCNPERDNPYDPLSPNYIDQGKIEGKVTTRKGIPIEGVEVYTEPKKYVTITDEKGGFELKVKEGKWKIIAEKEGFTAETVRVEVEKGRSVFSTLILNGLPQVVSCKITSFNAYMGFPVGSKYWADVIIQVKDEDGLEDIDSVWIIVNFDVSKRLKLLLSRASLDTYSGIILEEHCPGKNLETLIGRPIETKVKDKEGSEVVVSPFYMSRIIYSIPYVISPSKEVKEGEEVEFVWRKMQTQFEVDYQFYVIDYWSRDTVYKSPVLLDTTYKTPPFSQGTYYWKVMGKDEYGNKATSKGTGFTVVPSNKE
jgi:hypothetical protein